MNIADYVSWCVERLREGEQDAWHNLVEVDHSAIPLLIEAFRSESDPQTRCALAEIIWQHRVPSTVTFLAGLLEDSDHEVRQQAIDGLVCIGSAEARQVLESALGRLRAGSRERAEFGEYLEEAIELMDERSATERGQ